MWRRVFWYKLNISEKRSAYSRYDTSEDKKMEAARSSETLSNLYQETRRQFQQHSILPRHWRENHNPDLKRFNYKCMKKRTLLQEIFHSETKHELSDVQNDGQETHRTIRMSHCGPNNHLYNTQNIFWTAGMSLRFSASTKRKRLETEKASQKLQCCIIFPCSPSLSFMFLFQRLRTWTVVCEQAASHPPFPTFNFHHFTHSFRYKILSAPIFLRTRFCESSCKQKVTLHSASRVACIMLLPFLYLSVPLPPPYSRRCSDAETSSFYLACQISQPASAAFILHSTAVSSFELHYPANGAGESAKRSLWVSSILNFLPRIF